MTDLGNLGCTSTAYSVNSRGQIAGTSRLADCHTVHAVLWQNGNIYDLNDLVPPDSGLELFETRQINDEGVIAGNGLPKAVMTCMFVVMRSYSFRVMRYVPRNARTNLSGKIQYSTMIHRVQLG